MAKFECRHAEYHDDDDWFSVDAFDARSAAVVAAVRMDSNDSEMFVDPSYHVAPIYVREPGETAYELFTVSFEYSKSFYARKETDFDASATADSASSRVNPYTPTPSKESKDEVKT